MSTLRSNQKLRRLSKQFKNLKRRIVSSKVINSSSQNVILIIPCLCFCLYQALCVTEVYLKYDITAEALFYPGAVIIPPKVTFCIDENYLTCDSRCFQNSAQFFDAIHKFENIARMHGRWLLGHQFVRYTNMSMVEFSRRFVTLLQQQVLLRCRLRKGVFVKLHVLGRT